MSFIYRPFFYIDYNLPLHKIPTFIHIIPTIAPADFLPIKYSFVGLSN